MLRRAGTQLAALLVAWLAGSGGSGLAQTITFKPIQPLPQGSTLGVLANDQAAIPEVLSRTPEGNWTFSVPADPRRWRAEPIFVLEVPEHPVGVSRARKMSLQLAFSFKATQTEDVLDVPIALFEGAGVHVRDAIDQMEPFRRYEQVFLAQGLTRHFLQQLPSPQDGLTRRMAKRWFDAVHKAIDEEAKPLRMAPFVVDTALGAFQGDERGLAYIRTSAVYIRSLFWRDATELGGLLDRGKCEPAAALIGYLKEQHRQFPEAAQLRGVADPAQALAGYDTAYADACP